MSRKAVLALEDGSLFYGRSVGAKGHACGEVVFNTSMTGYQEILTDLSYSQQIVTLTYPHIGNTGINQIDQESQQISVKGLIIREDSLSSSNWRSQRGLNAYLKASNVVALAGIDTRKLTRLIRAKGALRGCIATDAMEAKEAMELACATAPLKGVDLAKKVSTNQAYLWQQGTWRALQNSYSKLNNFQFHVVAYDFGIKHNILRILAQKGCKLTVVPATTSVQEVLALSPDGVFLSNGPGDPEPCGYAIEAIKTLIKEGLPIFGICLGHQLLALACGARTEKMKFGHHGANHPVQDLQSKKVMITSQNHGFTVSSNELPSRLQVTHRSLFDGSIQGIQLADCPAFGFQGHPEASPGPQDIEPLFDRFLHNMKLYRKKK